ncbi:MAG: dihydropteroate synthase [Provencibacterium sp.]|jgi:5-methyltetrahydrofolate--homocysteine methyltransferase|nr:dihydropteroate synthase [Provencibacterium sp.]
MDIREKLKKGFFILDGAMGTMLQQAGLRPGERPELMALTHPEAVERIHRAYIAAGADAVYTNTFGANAHKLAGSGYTAANVIAAAVGCAKRAAKGSGCAVALDIGPVGELLEPAGSLSAETAYALFSEQVKAGEAAGADFIAIETMSDLYEAKLALLAAREHSRLPVFVTMTFEENGRTFTGCCPSAMALTLEALGADAIGVNCSLGPKKLRPIAEEICRWSCLPVIVKANAGLPDPQTGEYDVTPAQFAEEAAACAAAGVQILGGCCGTSPDYIRALRERLAGMQPQKREGEVPAALCSAERTVALNGVRVIGERINPTGKKRFKQALQQGDIDYILSQGLSQLEAGADLLDVNVGLPGIDEPAMMERVVRRLQAVCDAPLQLDSSNPAALERGLRAYSGKPVVNSVNGDPKTLRAVLPLVKKYGAAVVGLTLDEAGIPPTPEGRLAIARRILDAALNEGIRREDVYIDCLTLTVSVDAAEAGRTLDAVRLVRQELGLQTVLGVSNVSFGLPAREQLNAAFLTLALGAGLTLPIMNPNASQMMGAVAAYRVLSGQDPGAARYIAGYGQAGAEKAGASAAAQTAGASREALESAIQNGLEEESRRIASLLLQEEEPVKLVEGCLIPALDRVGERFEKGQIFLPQLLQSAQAAQAAFDRVRDRIAASGMASADRGTLVVATVRGDIHDIGKNIVRVILENYGFRVIDLGRDVPPERVAEAVEEHHIRLVGLSALMTTTLPSMEETIRILHERAPGCRIFVGGAVLTEDYAQKMGADYYAKDAKRSVDIAREVLCGEGAAL